MKENNIGKKLVEVIGDIVPVSLYEAETESYPYAVYEMQPEYHRTKDGVYKITADVPVTVYGKVYATARDAAEAAGKAVLEGMNGDGFRATLSSTDERCVEGVWQLELRFAVTQKVNN